MILTIKRLIAAAAVAIIIFVVITTTSIAQPSSSLNTQSMIRVSDTGGLNSLDDSWRNPLIKQGRLGSPVVEATPFVFNDRLYRLENNQKFWEVPNAQPGDYFQDDTVRIRDVEKDEIISIALANHAFGTALVWKERVYVFAGDYGREKPWRHITEINMTWSDDLVHWSEPVTVIRAEEGEQLFNTAVCRGENSFVLLYETNDNHWPVFTFKYCQSDDLIHWKRIPDAVFGRNKYVGGPALYYEGDFYYTLYLDRLDNNRGFETRITRSGDLLSWQDAPENRLFLTFDPTHQNIPELDADTRESNASDVELCYHKGITIVYFTGSDQTTAGDLQWATFNGTPRELFESFFSMADNSDNIPPQHAGDWLPILVKEPDKQEINDPFPMLKDALPSQRQLAYQESQLGAFVHFGPATSIRSDMLATPDASIFNPTELNAEQWVITAKSFGANHIVLTAKHHNGFCLWPTESTDYSVKSSLWKNGKGDVVAELANACRKHDIKLGLYLSAGDKKFGCWSTPDPVGKRKLVGDRQAYFSVFKQQIKELMTQYGPIFVFWIDGAYNPFNSDVLDPATGKPIGSELDTEISRYIHSFQPETVIFGAFPPDVRWSGSEQGWAPYPLWNAVKKGTDPWLPEDAQGWIPAEANLHTRSTWFWTPNSDHTLRSVKRLMKAHDESIGRGANLLINMTPDTRGLIPDKEVKRLNEFGEELRCRFSNPPAQTDDRRGWTQPGVLELNLTNPQIIDHLVIEEDIAKGQHVLNYVIEAIIHDQWQQIAQGQSIGRKRIETFEPITTSRLRLRITQSLGMPSIRLFAVYAPKTSPSLSLAVKGRTEYSIVLSQAASSHQKQAAQELQRYLMQISGALLPIVTDEQPLGAHEIIIGTNRHSKQIDPDMDMKQIGPNGFLLRTVGNHLMMVSADDLPALYVVYTFLEKYLGCRWLAPDVDDVPEQKTILLDPIDDLQIPPVEWRLVYCYEAMDAVWAAKLKLNGNLSCWSFTREHDEGIKGDEKYRYWGTFCHSFYRFVSPEQYFDDHPEYFAQIDGKRVIKEPVNGHPAQLCLTNPDVLRITIEKLRQMIKENPQARYWDFSQMDGDNSWCRCPECQAINEREGTPMGIILDFVNKVAAEFPDKTISTLAYTWSTIPPRHIRPADNVLIKLCTSWTTQETPIGQSQISNDQPALTGRSGPEDINDAAGNIKFCKNLKAWSAICDNLLVWDYVASNSHFPSPFPNLLVQKPNIQFFVDNHTRGLFFYLTRERGSEFRYLRSYLLAKLMWNPAMDDNAIIDDYLHGYYGPAAGPIRNYIDIMHQALKDSGKTLFIWDQLKKHRRGYLSPDMLNQYKLLFDQAEMLVTDQPQFLQRVREARLPIMYFQLQREYGDKEERKKVADEFFTLADQTGLWMIREVGMEQKTGHINEFKENIMRELNQ